MRNCCWGVALAAAVAAAPVAVKAQVFPAPTADCCGHCHLPLVQCHCVRTRPVVQTQLRAEQTTVLRNVTESHIRCETYVENVPVTTTQTVTVDEGSYQLVWVPKPTTKQVARTVMVPQSRTRAVPYQVTRTVPQTVTRVVPYQTVQHVTEVVPGPIVWMPQQLVAAPAITALPIVSAAPTPSAVPATQAADGGWQTVPARPRTAATPAPEPAATPVPPPQDSPPRQTSGRFAPALPSAATVWNARGDLATR